jgi:hypothetical protein
MARPIHSLPVGHLPKRPATSATQIAIEASATAATPEETHCSATTTQALPTTSSVPTISADFHSARVGFGEPRSRAKR